MNTSLTKTRFITPLIAAALAALLASPGADAGRAGPFKTDHDFHATCWSTSVVVRGMDGPTTTSHITGLCYETSLGMLTLDAYQHVTASRRPQSGEIQPVSIFATSVYTTESGDALNALFAGGGTINLPTGVVDFAGVSRFAGGTGRFLTTSGSAVVFQNARRNMPNDADPQADMLPWDYVVTGIVSY